MTHIFEIKNKNGVCVFNIITTIDTPSLFFLVFIRILYIRKNQTQISFVMVFDKS